MSHRFPILFYKPPTALIGPGAPITIPKATQPPEKHLPDYEVELTIVIGKAAKNVSEEDALDYVLAYTGANDVRTPVRTLLTTQSADCHLQMSFRFHQLAVSQWGFSKSFGKSMTKP